MTKLAVGFDRELIDNKPIIDAERRHRTIQQPIYVCFSDNQGPDLKTTYYSQSVRYEEIPPLYNDVTIAEPVSLTCVACKIMELIIASEMLS